MDDSPDGTEMLNSRNALIIALEAGLLLLINLIALSGNLFLCYVIYNKPKYHTTTNILILALTMCYGFIALFVMPFTVGVLITGRWVFGRVVCDIQAFLFLDLTWISLLMVTLMTISRFFKVTRLGFYKKWFSIERSYAMIMGIWLFVTILLVCTEAGSSTIYGFSPKDSLCSISFSTEYATKHTIYAVVTLALYVSLPIVSIILWSAMQRHNVTVAHFKTDDGQPIQRSEDKLRKSAEERKTNQLLFCLIMSVMVFWLPAVVINILAFSMTLPRRAQLASTFFWFAVPATHPIIYGALYRPFSKEVMRALPTTVKRQNQVYAEEAL